MNRKTFLDTLYKKYFIPGLLSLAVLWIIYTIISYIINYNWYDSIPDTISVSWEFIMLPLSILGLVLTVACLYLIIDQLGRLIDRLSPQSKKYYTQFNDVVNKLLLMACGILLYRYYLENGLFFAVLLFGVMIIPGVIRGKVKEE